mmetsp:Transcript_31688/g.75630  ORF Transcript_31688/g.75630 Transcript_31688/m.75630 type:complete len:291 (-) Transcript_31688:71-943(-)
MVVFICDGCGETLKKAKVDQHAARCRDCASVSCVDCSLSFWGDDYRFHTSCITEAERYEKTIFRGTRKLDASGTGHRPTPQHPSGNLKKLTPQEAWQNTIQSAVEQAPEGLRTYMTQLADLENVPRKEKPFRNFLTNSLKLKGKSGEKAKAGMWALLVKIRNEERKKREGDSATAKTKQEGPKQEENKDETNNAEEISRSEPARKLDEAESSEMPSEKKLAKAMKKALKAAPNRELKFKSLRKQVQTSLALKVNGKKREKEWKRLCNECVKANPEKMTVDKYGKLVSLVK